MSRRDWLRNGIAWALIVAAAVVVIGVGLSVHYELKQADQRQDVAPQDPYTADDQEHDPCARISGLVEYRKCLADEAKAKREERREYYDLEAQHDMALWTFAILLASILGLGVTGSGVYYVARALRATQQIALDERRPWISLAPTIDEPMVFEKNGATINIKVVVKNVGREPATILSIQPRALTTLQPEALSDFRKFCDGLRKRLSGTASSVFTLFPDQHYSPTVTTVLLNEQIEKGQIEIGGKRCFMPIIYLCASYRFASSKTVHQTGYVYAIANRAGHNGYSELGAPRILNAVLRIEPMAGFPSIAD